MAWILVPLQYLFLIWRAEKLLAETQKSANLPAHRAKLAKSQEAVVKVEILQKRFPAVTDWVDVRRRRDALRNQISA